MSNQDEKIQEVLAKLVGMFQAGQFPEYAKRVFIQKAAADHGIDRPCKSWSCNNFLIMLLSGTEDARGYQQWQAVGRQVKKGAKSFSILGPCTKMITVKVRDKETGEEREEKRQIITGFRAIPVFRYEDTEGAEIYYDYTPAELPPLYNVAISWGMKVYYQPFAGRALGSFNPFSNSIKLMTVEPDVFYHELAHAAHDRLKKKETGEGLEGGQVASQEIVADLAACTLCEVFSPEASRPHDTWKYIQHYSEGSPQAALKNIIALLNEVAAVVGLIVQTANDLNVKQEEGMALQRAI